MLDNNRKANKKAMRYALENYEGIDEFVVNDQEFLESDYEEGFKYVGHHKERQGFVNTRNQLLEWFYNSDADYAIWMDANAKVTKSSLNDLVTLIDVAKSGQLEVDAVFSTLGIIVSGERIEAKKMPDYFDNIYLVKFKQGYDIMHGLLISNFKKKYNMPIYIDKRCDPRKGTSEDIYFARLIRRFFNYRLCPTITVSKPTNKTSTWVANKTGYDYPPIDLPTVDAYIDELLNDKTYASQTENSKTYHYIRSTRHKSLLKPYKPRSKVKSNLFKGKK